jgi:large subunit ribosomal protein L25
MAQIELNVSLREALGKGAARGLRRQGLIPAVMYGKGSDPCGLTVDPKLLKAAIATDAGWNNLITLKGDGPFDGKVVILKDMQVDPVRTEPLHADFQVIDLRKKVHVMVPLHPTGKSEGEKQGGTLELIRHEIELICLPVSIPASLKVDVAELNIGDALHVQDIPLDEGVELPPDVNFTVLTISGRSEEAEEPGLEGEVAAEAGIATATEAVE